MDTKSSISNVKKDESTDTLVKFSSQLVETPPREGRLIRAIAAIDDSIIAAELAVLGKTAMSEKIVLLEDELVRLASEEEHENARRKLLNLVPEIDVCSPTRNLSNIMSNKKSE